MRSCVSCVGGVGVETCVARCHDRLSRRDVNASFGPEKIELERSGGGCDLRHPLSVLVVEIELIDPV